MRIDLSVAYWPWFAYEEQVELALAADAAGLGGVWVSEAWGQDAVSVLAVIASRTERIAIGSGLMQIPARQPSATAMAAATLDVISGGRFRLGLGVSGPQVSEGWYGVRFARPLARTREYVAIVRAALAGEKLSHSGEHWQLPLEGGLGVPLRLMAGPKQARVPVYLGAIGPRAIELTGEIADGWMPAFFGPHDPEKLFAPLRRGLERAGRERGEIDVAPLVPVAVEATLDAAREAVAPMIAFYLGAMGAKEKNFYVELCDRLGLGSEARAVQELFLAGEREAAVEAVAAELIDLFAIACTPEELDGRLRAYEEAGADALVALVFGTDRPRTVERLSGAQGGLAGGLPELG